tara:strand:+ start:15623 stop:15793 length:171 start_codon:yes stop_codon:yes gene_type:complete
LEILLITEELIDRGFQENDAAEILGVNLSTISGWRKKETARTRGLTIERSRLVLVV